MYLNHRGTWQWQKTKMKTGPKPDIGSLPSVMWDIWNTNKRKKKKRLKVVNVSYGQIPNTEALGKSA